jgi:hypothetical protein
MPRGDGTGPMGLGPMTGRAAGYCAGYPTPGFMNPYGGRWLGSGYAPYGGPYAARVPGAYPYFAPFPGRGLGLAWGRGGGRGMGMAWRRGRGRGGGFGRGWGWAW